MTGWIIFCSVLAFFLLLLLTPIRFCFSYSEQPKLTVWVAFVPLKILSPETAEKQRKPEGQPHFKKEKNKRQNVFSGIREEKGLGGFLDFLKKLSHIAFRAVKRTGRHLVAERCEVEVVVGGEDSAAVAERYGTICSAAFPIWARLLSLTRCRRHSLRICPDFFSREHQIRCRIRIRLRLVWVMRATFAACGSFLWLMLKEKIHAAGKADGNAVSQSKAEQSSS